MEYTQGLIRNENDSQQQAYQLQVIIQNSSVKGGRIGFRRGLFSSGDFRKSIGNLWAREKEKSLK